VGIWGQPREAPILDRAADGEMVEVLEPMIGQAEQLVDEVVEVAPHPEPAHAGRLGLQAPGSGRAT